MADVLTRTPSQWATDHLEAQPDAASRVQAFSELPPTAPVIPLWHRLREELDPATLLPAAVRMLERRDIVPGIPDLVDFVLEHHGLLPELQADLPRLAWITLDTRLLDQARPEDQPRVRCLFINQALQHCDFGRAAELLKSGYRQQGLRALDVVHYYRMSLAHPRFAPVTQAVLAILREQRIINLSLVEVSLHHVQCFSHAHSSVASEVLEYVRTLGPRVPHYESRVLERLRAMNWDEHCRCWLAPQAEAAPGDGKQWDRWNDWKVRYTEWPLMQALPEQSQQRWLRAQLLNAADLFGDGPGAVTPRRSLQAFALYRMHQSTRPEPDDLLALGTAWQTLEGKLEDNWLPDRLACLFCLFWREVDLQAPPWSACREQLVPLATDLFQRQISDWLAAGGPSLPARVSPMPGVDLDRLQSEWRGSAECWETFWQSYRSLLGAEGTRVIPEEPDTDRSPYPVRFLRLNAADGLQPLVRFLVRTPAPKRGTAIALWRELLTLAEHNHTQLFDKELSRLESRQQADVVTEIGRSKMIFYEPPEGEEDED